MKFIRYVAAIAISVFLSVTSLACGRYAGQDAPRSSDFVVLASDKDRGYLGINVDDVTAKLMRKKKLLTDEGAYVVDVVEDSPAEAAGLRDGDVIVELDGKKITDASDLTREVRRTKPGSEVALTVFRDGEKKILKATLDKAPRTSFSFNTPLPRIHVAPRISLLHESAMYGLMLEGLNRQLGEYFGAPNGQGVLVKSVKRNSDAEQAGFKAGDVILKVGSDDVSEVDDVWRSLDDYKEGEKVEFEILRKGTKQKLSLTMKEDERDMSIHRFHFDGNDDDVIIDLFTPEDRHEFHRGLEKLKRELELLKHDLHDNMIDLKSRLKKKIERVRVGVNV
jgi:predicted metalloprotease with PDZ domain